MAIVDGSLQEGYKDAAWFAANPTLVLLVGQKVNLEQTGTYKLGDGTTQLSALSFLGGSGSGLSGLTTNKVLKATSSTTAGDSNITDDGTNVVVNGLRIRSISNATYFNASGVNGHYWNSFNDAINLFRVKNDGVVNIPQGTSDRIMALDTNKDVVYLSTTTYPSLTELSYVKDVTSSIQTQLDGLAPIASPTFTGTPLAPTASANTNNTQIATTAYVDDLKANFINKKNSDTPHTGTTSPTVIHSFEITPGTCQANDVLKFYIRHLSTNNANSKTVKMWANTSNTISGATQLSNYAYTTNAGGVFPFKRSMIFKNSLSSQKMINTSVSHANDEVSYPNNGDVSLALNFTASVWILIEVTLANAADTFIMNLFNCKIER